MSSKKSNKNPSKQQPDEEVRYFYCAACEYKTKSEFAYYRHLGATSCIKKTYTNIPQKIKNFEGMNTVQSVNKIHKPRQVRKKNIINNIVVENNSDTVDDDNMINNNDVINNSDADASNNCDAINNNADINNIRGINGDGNSNWSCPQASSERDPVFENARAQASSERNSNSTKVKVHSGPVCDDKLPSSPVRNDKLPSGSERNTSNDNSDVNNNCVTTIINGDNNNTITNIDTINNTTTTNVYLLPFNTTETNNKIMSELNKDFFSDLFNDNTNKNHFVINFIKRIFFDENKPYNYVIYMANLNSKHCHIFEKTSEKKAEWVSHDSIHIGGIVVEYIIKIFKLILDKPTKNEILDPLMIKHLDNLIKDLTPATDTSKTFETNMRRHNTKEMARNIKTKLADFSIITRSTYLSYKRAIKMVPHNFAYNECDYLRKKNIELRNENITLTNEKIDLNREINSLKEHNEKILQELSCLKLNMQYLNTNVQLMQQKHESFASTVKSGLVFTDSIYDNISTSLNKQQKQYVKRTISTFRDMMQPFIKKKKGLLF